MLRIHVALPSGRHDVFAVHLSSSIGDLALAAQQSLGESFLRLVTPEGRLLDPTESLESAGLQDNDHLTAIVQQVAVAATDRAFLLYGVMAR